MKVLFVNPPNTTTLHITESGKYVEENIGNDFFPLPRIPFEVMAELNDMRELEKDILLLDFEWYRNPNLAKEDLVELIVKKNPDIILTTIIAQANTDTIDWLTTKIKEKHKKTLIILGGQAVRYFRKKIFKFCPNIDFALNGNLGNNLRMLIRLLIGQNDINLKNIDGLIYKEKNGRIKENSQTNSREVSNFSPEILYNKYKEKIYEIVNFVNNKRAYVLGVIQFSKGCPFVCTFCAARTNYIEKKISNVIDEIKYLYSIGIHKFYIADLTFGINHKTTNIILNNLKKIRKKYKKFGFRCVTRTDLITEEFVNKLSKAGCYEVGIGIECNEETILNSMNKKTSPDKNLKALNILGRSSILFKLFIIEGYPHSNSLSSKRTFELLNYLESKKYSYFIQPALSRDIIPSQQRFKEKEEKGILRRRTLNQLDFRHDCRKFGWDTDRSIRSFCLLMLAYPSTELGKNNKDTQLQKRVILDIPFPKDGVNINCLIKFLKELPLKTSNKEEMILNLRIDLAHFIDGVYTFLEIQKKLEKLYPHLKKEEIYSEVDFCKENLRKSGLIDSLGNPNSYKIIFRCNKNFKYKNLTLPKRVDGILLFWNGADKRYLYFPPNKEAIKIKTCFYENIPTEVFEFLVLSRGFYSLEQISEKLYALFNNMKVGFRDIEQSKKTTKRIYLTCKKYGLVH